MSSCPNSPPLRGVGLPQARALPERGRRAWVPRYFGVLSRHSSRRRLVVPAPPPDATAHKPPPARGDQLELLGETDDAPAPRAPWESPKGDKRRAWLLAHVLTTRRCACPSSWCWGSGRSEAGAKRLAERERVSSAARDAENPAALYLCGAPSGFTGQPSTAPMPARTLRLGGFWQFVFPTRPSS